MSVTRRTYVRIQSICSAVEGIASHHDSFVSRMGTMFPLGTRFHPAVGEKPVQGTDRASEAVSRRPSENPNPNSGIGKTFREEAAIPTGPSASGGGGRRHDATFLESAPNPDSGEFPGSFGTREILPRIVTDLGGPAGSIRKNPVPSTHGGRNASFGTESHGLAPTRPERYIGGIRTPLEVRKPSMGILDGIDGI